MQVVQAAQGSIDQASQPFIGQWNHLVSTTNWEKGKIIHNWREALIRAGAPASEYSDDAWSRRVGGLSGQHAGRLRRVYARYVEVREQFPGLYWSHFQAALDWDDAEMWLEGAVQESWSVNQMRQRRAEALGTDSSGAGNVEPLAEEMDEDALAAQETPPERPLAPQFEAVHEASSPAGPDFGDEEESAPSDPFDPGGMGGDIQQLPAPAVEASRPFEEVGPLPPDLEEALENFKIAILRHKSAGWTEVSLAQILAALDGLRTLACSA